VPLVAVSPHRLRVVSSVLAPLTRTPPVYSSHSIRVIRCRLIFNKAAANSLNVVWISSLAAVLLFVAVANSNSFWEQFELRRSGLITNAVVEFGLFKFCVHTVVSTRTWCRDNGYLVLLAYIFKCA